ncbi:MAG: hypothetical protein QM599_10270 [Pseudoxanthomonas sp.]
MHWLFLAFAVALLLFAFTVKSAVVLLLCLLLSLAGFITWALGQYKSRIGAQGDNRQMIDPVELHRLRTEIAARKAAADEKNATAEHPP